MTRSLKVVALVIHLLLGFDTSLLQFLRAMQVYFPHLDFRFPVLNVGFNAAKFVLGSIPCCDQFPIVEPRQQLALLHHCIDIDIQLSNNSVAQCGDI